MRILASALVVGLLCVVCAAPAAALAEEPKLNLEIPQEQDEGQEQEQPEPKQAEDNTGTNPINFTYDARFYTEASWFDGGSLVAPHSSSGCRWGGTCTT